MGTMLAKTLNIAIVFDIGANVPLPGSGRTVAPGDPMATPVQGFADALPGSPAVDQTGQDAGMVVDMPLNPVSAEPAHRVVKLSDMGRNIARAMGEVAMGEVMIASDGGRVRAWRSTVGDLNGLVPSRDGVPASMSGGIGHSMGSSGVRPKDPGR